MNVEILRPSIPAPMILNYIMDWPQWRGVSEKVLEARIKYPLQAGHVLFGHTSSGKDFAFTWARLNADYSKRAAEGRVPPQIWNFDQGLLWVIDVFGPAGLKARDYVRPVLQMLVNKGYGVEGEDVVFRKPSGNVGRIRIRHDPGITVIQHEHKQAVH